MKEDPSDAEKSRTMSIIGIGLVLGGGVGVILFAITGSPFWMTFMPGVGLVGGSFAATRARRSP